MRDRGFQFLQKLETIILKLIIMPKFTLYAKLTKWKTWKIYMIS